MKQILIFFILIESLLCNTYAQKEIYFSTRPLDSIKVESIHGVETRISILPGSYNTRLLSFPLDFEPSLFFGYFNEKRFLNIWTLNTSIGLYNTLYKALVLERGTDGILGNTNGKFKYNYALTFEARIEPRWYLGYKQRYQQGKAQLNSGYFVSFPLLFQALILDTPEPLLNEGWISKYFNGALIFNPTTGFRQAISKNLFLEGSIGFGAITHFRRSDNFYFLNPVLYPNLNIKLAYCF